MDIPVGVNTGLPGPPVPGECQHPMYLDRVCLHFPDLKLIMQHGADPWWEIAIRLMIKYRNLYLMTSAYSPKYLPESVLHYMNTRGKNKIMFASDHPVLSMDRCLEEAQELDLRPGFWTNTCMAMHKLYCLESAIHGTDSSSSLLPALVDRCYWLRWRW